MDHLTRIENLEVDMREVKANQINYMGKHHELDKEMVGLKTDMTYVRESVAKITSNTNYLLLTVVGGFLLAIVTFIVKGGLS